MAFAKVDSPRLTTKGTPVMFHGITFTFHTDDEKGKYSPQEIQLKDVDFYSRKEGGNVSLDLHWKVRGNSSWIDLKTGCSINNIDPTGENNSLSAFLNKLGFFTDTSTETVEASDDDFPQESSEDDFSLVESDEDDSYSSEDIVEFLNNAKGSKFYGDVKRNGNKKWTVDVGSLTQV